MIRYVNRESGIKMFMESEPKAAKRRGRPKVSSRDRFHLMLDKKAMEALATRYSEMESVSDRVNAALAEALARPRKK
jgi:hypothetical protein